MARRTYRRVRYEEVTKASQDVGIIVTEHCYLDNLLEGLLRRVFVRHRAVSEMFDAGRGALWQFPAKVKLAFALGLLTKTEHDDLLIMNRMRNCVAHRIRGVTFRSLELRRLAGQVWAPKRCNGIPRPSIAMVRVGAMLHFRSRTLEKEWRIHRLANRHPRGGGSKRVWPVLTRDPK